MFIDISWEQHPFIHSSICSKQDKRSKNRSYKTRGHQHGEHLKYDEWNEITASARNEFSTDWDFAGIFDSNSCRSSASKFRDSHFQDDDSFFPGDVERVFVEIKSLSCILWNHCMQLLIKFHNINHFLMPPHPPFEFPRSANDSSFHSSLTKMVMFPIIFKKHDYWKIIRNRWKVTLRGIIELLFSYYFI